MLVRHVGEMSNQLDLVFGNIEEGVLCNYTWFGQSDWENMKKSMVYHMYDVFCFIQVDIDWLCVSLFIFKLIHPFLYLG